VVHEAPVQHVFPIEQEELPHRDPQHRDPPHPRATTPAAAPSQVTESSRQVNATFVVVERQVRQLNVDTSEGKKLLLLKVMVYFKLVAREKINPLVARTPNTQLNNVN
jgi:hypothetical protein